LNSFNNPFYSPVGFENSYPPGNNAIQQYNSESRKNKKQLLRTTLVLGGGLLLYLFMQQLYRIVLLNNKELYNLYLSDELFTLLVEMLYSFVCVCMPFALTYFILRKAKLTDRIIPFNKPSSGIETYFLVLAGIGICMGGNIITSIITNYASGLGIGFHSYDYAVEQASELPSSVSILLLNIVHTAIVPAFLEELAFRGFLMQPLRKYGDFYAVICSAVVFGLIHGNMSQSPFAVIVGIILGLLCVYTGSMWPNILLHLSNNLISVLQGYAGASTGGIRMYLISGIVIYGFIAIGILALCGYFCYRKKLPALNNPNYPGFRSKWFLFFGSPTIILALCYLVFTIITDIYFK